jgi:hypothetical protein
LFDTPGVDFYSLQKADGVRRSRRRLADFTPALLFNLDLVITCETVVAHLARAVAYLARLQPLESDGASLPPTPTGQME